MSLQLFTSKDGMKLPRQFSKAAYQNR